MNDVAELRALKARLAILEEALPKPYVEPSPEEAQHAARQGSVVRDANGAVVADRSEEAYELRRQERARIEAANAADYEARCRAGLPSGLFRDPCGMVRTKDGLLATLEEIEGRPDQTPAALRRAAVDAQRAADHHSWLEANGLLDKRETWPEGAQRLSADKE